MTHSAADAAFALEASAGMPRLRRRAPASRRAGRALSALLAMGLLLSVPGLSGRVAAYAAEPALPAQPPVPSLPTVAKPIPVRVIVVANFEIGEDKGDVPGEFQLWAEREHLDEAIPVRGVLHPLMRNKEGLYGIVWRNAGSMFGGPENQLMALLLDPRFDFRKTYWLFTGISGVDPELASVGSAAWARWVVSGDPMREFDDREIPQGWPYGLYAIGATKPNALPPMDSSFASLDGQRLSMAMRINPALARWAYERTKDVPIPDTPALRAARAKWKGYPNAQKPPFVLMGETLGAMRYWHGPGRTQWARDWVKLWTGGKGRFAMTNMESQLLLGAMAIAAKQGLVDLDRMMVLRTASNPSMPPPGVSGVESMEDVEPGMVAGYEANYRVGAPVLHELLTHWDRYADHVPGIAPDETADAQSSRGE